MPYQRKEQKWVSRGVNLSKPPDLLESEQPRLLNLRAFLQGVLQNRPGMSAINAAPLEPIHTITRLNNYLPSASQSYARFIGASTKLYSDDAAHTLFSTVATGFSGDPIQCVVMRPEESPEPFLYVSTSSKSGKARVNGAFTNHGIAPPTVAAYAQPAATSYQIISDFEAVGSWTNGGTAGAISLQVRIATTIAKIVYDGAAPNWATVQPTTLDEAVQPGMLLVTGGTVETVLVESVSEAVTNTTIQSIQYDNITGPGACVIQLSAPTDGLARDSMLRIDSGGGNDEVVRVLSVTPGPGGLPSFSCVTVNIQAATRTITGLRSFRAYFANNHAAGEALASGNLESDITVGTGYINLVGTLDLSVVNSRPITDDDIIHISIKIDDLSLLTEGRIAFDVDRATNDFTQNYFYWPFRSNDLAPATTGSITALSAGQRIQQRGQIDQTVLLNAQSQLWQHIDRNAGNQDTRFDNPSISGFGPVTDIGNPPDVSPTQTTLGASQWTEMRIRVGDLMRFRVGSDTSRSLHDVAAIRIQLQTTGTVRLDADAWWIGGSYGPDSGVGAPYNYRYVYRSSTTGAQSNPSPPLREGIVVRRQRIQGTLTAGSDAQADWIDIYRTGGALIVADNSPPWFYVMSVPNTGSPTFTDDFGDDIVIRQRQLEFDNFQPFLDLDIPRSGVVNVVGTEVTRVSGDTFNTSWPPGTLMVINNVPYSLYKQPSTTAALSLNENAGTQTAVTWFITSPRLMAQPLPAMWGPFGGGLFEPVMFACGSTHQPGHVFWTRSGNPDANSQFGSLELTNPSETLMNGVVFRSQVFVFSTESLYVLSPTQVGSELRFAGAKVAGNRGLLQRDALCVGDEGIFYLSRDGIYLTAGAESISLTDEMLYPLFPHEGAVGVTTNGIVPPDFTQKARLSYGESELYFDYIDTDGNEATLLYDIKLKGWFPYSYTPGVLTHYLEEGSGLHTLLLGGTDGKLYLSGGTLDGTTQIDCVAQTPRFDGGDPRSNKQWANGQLDFNSDGATVTVDVFADNETTLLNSLPVSRNGRGQRILDFRQAIHRNLLMEISGTAPLTLYGFDWEWTQVSVSELTEQRNAYATQLTFVEYAASFYLQLAHISSSDLTITITVDSQAPDTYPVTSSGGVLNKTWVMLRARKGRLWTIKVEGDEEFSIIPQQSSMYIKDWKGIGAYQANNAFGDTTF